MADNVNRKGGVLNTTVHVNREHPETKTISTKVFRRGDKPDPEWAEAISNPDVWTDAETVNLEDLAALTGQPVPERAGNPEPIPGPSQRVFVDPAEVRTVDPETGKVESKVEGGRKAPARS